MEHEKKAETKGVAKKALRRSLRREILKKGHEKTIKEMEKADTRGAKRPKLAPVEQAAVAQPPVPQFHAPVKRLGQTKAGLAKKRMAVQSKTMHEGAFKFSAPKTPGKKAFKYTGKCTIAQPFSFMKREEEKLRQKEMKKEEEANKKVDIDDEITVTGMVTKDKKKTKARSISLARLERLAQPKTRPRIASDNNTPALTNRPALDLRKVLSKPEPIKRSTRPITKVHTYN